MAYNINEAIYLGRINQLTVVDDMPRSVIVQLTLNIFYSIMNFHCLFQCMPSLYYNRNRYITKFCDLLTEFKLNALK